MPIWRYVKCMTCSKVLPLDSRCSQHFNHVHMPCHADGSGVVTHAEARLAEATATPHEQIALLREDIQDLRKRIERLEVHQ